VGDYVLTAENLITGSGFTAVDGMAVCHYRRRLLSRAPPAWHRRANVLAGGPLAKRELEVLRHVSGLLSNAEVAIEMSIAIHAVKTASQEHLLQTGGRSPRRGGPPGPPARADLMSPCPRPVA
jgi:hypothetical protein